MSNIQTNFRAEDMLGVKKAVTEKVEPKKASKPAPVVLEPAVVVEPVVEESVESESELESESESEAK
jgi:hypothetical protein